MSTAVETN